LAETANPAPVFCILMLAIAFSHQLFVTLLKGTRKRVCPAT